MEKEINNELEKTLNYLQEEIIPSLKRQIEEKQKIVDKAIEILKDTSVDMPETLLIETIDYARHILNGGE